MVAKELSSWCACGSWSSNRKKEMLCSCGVKEVRPGRWEMATAARDLWERVESYEFNPTPE